MKKVLIGGFLAVIGSIWAIAIGAYVQLHLAANWNGSRFWASAVQLGVVVPLVAALILLALGMAVLGIEYFRKER